MSESGWRPDVVTSVFNRKRAPAFGPRRTTSSAVPAGSESASRAEFSSASTSPLSCRADRFIVAVTSGGGNSSFERVMDCHLLQIWTLWSLSKLRIRPCVQQSSERAGILDFDVEHPARLIGVAVHQFRGFRQFVITRLNLTGHRSVHVGDALGRFDLADHVARPHL